jgi:anti-sigma factor RsiW
MTGVGVMGVLEVAHVGRQLVPMHATLGDVPFKLARVGLAAAPGAAILAAVPCQWTNAGPTLVIDDIIGIAPRVFRRAVSSAEAWQLEARAQIDEDALERPHVAIGSDDRLADRIGGRVGLGNGPIEQ